MDTGFPASGDESVL